MLETFPNPGVTAVEMTSDELTALGPGNAQPDMYVVHIDYRPDALCLESKALKLYLGNFRNEEAFCETLAVQVKNDVAAALRIESSAVTVTLTQKSRGGISITATA
jgi:7-cyano-7-deazaguanine reductase